MIKNASLAAALSSLDETLRAEILADVTEAEATALEFDWQFWARPSQLPPPGAWRVWLLLAGRGFGKTRTGAEWVRAQVEQNQARRIALVARSAADLRDVMVEGESGLLAISPSWFRPHYEPSKRRLTWPNGAIATTFTADEPAQLRGPQHDAAWCDELAAWRYPETWDMLMFGLRLGADPRCVVTTTPRPVRLIKELLARAGGDVAVTRGSTYHNRAHLAPPFLAEIVRRYEGSRLGRQEIEAELLEDVPGALWSREVIERARYGLNAPLPELSRVVVAIDPAVSAGEEADETGIIVAALGRDGHGYVLDDLSGRYKPLDWATRAIAAYRAHKADRIVAEVNNGGDLVEATLRIVDAGCSYKAVHAARGKTIRAEPVAALYEQGRVHHLGAFARLEDQMCNFVSQPERRASGVSPDRLDALVWALTELMIESSATGLLDYYRDLYHERHSPKS